MARFVTRVLTEATIDVKERLPAFHVDNEPEPLAGWKIIGLVSEAPTEQQA